VRKLASEKVIGAETGEEKCSVQSVGGRMDETMILPPIRYKRRTDFCDFVARTGDGTEKGEAKSEGEE